MRHRTQGAAASTHMGTFGQADVTLAIEAPPTLQTIAADAALRWRYFTPDAAVSLIPIMLVTIGTFRRYRFGRHIARAVEASTAKDTKGPAFQL
jgi:hypothetical protein